MLPKEMKEPEQVGKDKWKTSLFFFFFFLLIDSLSPHLHSVAALTKNVLSCRIAQ